jgi:hypothetical protein
MNPAFRPRQGFIGVPGLSNVAANVYTNALNLENLIFLKNGQAVTFLHPSVGANEFLSNLPDQSFINADISMKLLSLGLLDKNDGFWSFDLGLRANADVTIPKTLFELLKVGFSDNENEATQYRIENLNTTLNSYLEVGVGYSRAITERLDLGAKVKILAGLANIDFNIDRLEIASERDLWVAQAKAGLNASAPGLKALYDSDGQLEDFETGNFSASGYGLGVDLGAAYKLTDKAILSLAVTDLGFIAWSEGSSVNLASPNTQINITPSDYTIDIDGSTTLADNISSVTDDILGAVNLKNTNKKRSGTSLITHVNAGLEYEVWSEQMTAGILSTTYFGKSQTMTEVTLAANYKPVTIPWLSAALSYSFLQGGSTVGFALHIAPRRGVNFFVASDYLLPNVNSSFIPVSSKAVNFQAGLSIPIGRTIETY